MLKRNGSGKVQFDSVATFNMFIQALFILGVVMAAYFTTINSLEVKLETLCVRMNQIEKNMDSCSSNLRTLELEVIAYMAKGNN